MMSDVFVTVWQVLLRVNAGIAKSMYFDIFFVRCLGFVSEVDH